jgi:hypothetical protein
MEDLFPEFFIIIKGAVSFYKSILIDDYNK